MATEVMQFFSSKSASRASTGKSSSSSSTRRSTYSLRALGVRPFGWQSRTNYDATEQLLKSRSDSFKLHPLPPDDDIWKKPPPDFRPQNFAPRPPKRNTREAIEPWKYGAQESGEEEEEEEEERTKIELPRIIRPKEEEEERFDTVFRLLDTYEAKMRAAKEGTVNAGPYHTPKIHDFRPYPPIKKFGLPEFETNYERDPFNLKFHSQRLDIIHGIGYSEAAERDIRGRQMAPPLSPPQQFDARLVLTKSPWPKRPQSYTRYRRANRDPKSALMDRIDEALHAQWAKEKKETELELQQECNL